MPNQNQKTGIREWLRESITFKLLSIGVLILILLIPDSMISNLIRERQLRVNEANEDISRSYGGEQKISGPILCLPYQYVREDDNKITREKDIIYLMPDKLDILSNLKHNVRRRGLYEAVVYDADISLAGHFDISKAHDIAISQSYIQWDEAFFAMEVAGITGIKDRIEMSIGDSLLNFESGIKSCQAFSSGLSTRYSLTDIDKNVKLTFSIPLKLRGAGSLSFEPVGEITAHFFFLGTRRINWLV